MKKRQLIMAQFGVLLLIVAIIWIKITVHFDVTLSPGMLVNVNEYGAIGDGEHDNTKAFQTAIDDVFQQGGGTVFVPSGTYSLGPILLKNNVHLRGEQRDTVVLKLADDAPDDYTRLITTADDTSIQSLTCDGNYQKHPNGIEHMHCIFIFDNENVVIKNNKIINAVGDGISVSGSNKTSENITIENNFVKENQRSQIVIEQVNHLQVTNNVIESKTGRPALHFEPWEEQQYDDATISGNKIDSNVNGNCVLLAGADSEQAGKDQSGYYFNNIKFYQNEVHCPKGALLLMDTSTAKVFDNELTVKEIHIWRKNQQVRIRRNHINAVNGIRIEGGKEGELISTGTMISRNTFNSTKDGVNIHAGANKTLIKDNHFTGSNEAAGVALFASDNITNTVISGNTFQHYQTGVFLDYDYYSATKIEGVRITNNHFFVSKKRAVVQTNHNRRLIKELVISNNQFN